MEPEASFTSVFTLIQSNPILKTPVYLLKIRFNIILPTLPYDT
jgi:hypothetical protein